MKSVSTLILEADDLCKFQASPEDWHNITFEFIDAFSRESKKLWDYHQSAKLVKLNSQKKTATDRDTEMECSDEYKIYKQQQFIVETLQHYIIACRSRARNNSFELNNS